MIITKEDLLEFFTNAPGVLLAMLHTQFVMPCAEAVAKREADDKAAAEKEAAERAASGGVGRSETGKSEVWDNSMDDDEDE